MSRRSLLALSAFLAVAGAVLLWWSLSNPQYEDAPLPSATFSVSEPSPTGPTQGDVRRGDVAAGTMTPEKMAPEHIYIPALGVYAPFSRERQDGRKMTLPTDLRYVGLNADAGALDSTEGTVLVSSHVSWHRQDGPLHDLYQLAPGNAIYTTDASGARTHWLVGELGVSVKTALPQSFFAKDGQRRLVGVTCGGPVTKVGSWWIHRDNVWVIAYPVGAPD